MINAAVRVGYYFVTRKVIRAGSVTSENREIGRHNWNLQTLEEE